MPLLFKYSSLFERQNRQANKQAEGGARSFPFTAIHRAQLIELFSIINLTRLGAAPKTQP